MTASAPAAPARPSASVIEACNRQAATTKEKTVEIVKGSGVAGLVGAAGGAIADGGSGAGKGAGIGGVLGALYGLNENRKTDERSREAYAACMRSRGYGG